jgi:hypothetical protein
VRVSCPECGKLVSQFAKTCPGCGFAFSEELMSSLLSEEKDAKQGCIKNLKWLVIVLIALSLFGRVISFFEKDDWKEQLTSIYSENKSIDIPHYRIFKTEPSHYSSTKRYTVRVHVNYALRSSKLKLISNDIIDKYKVSHPHNALTIFFYLPESSTIGHYTAGKAVWAPFGEWGKAGDVSTGDYSSHVLKVEAGSAIKHKPSKAVTKGVSLNLKKKIFYEVVQAEDIGFEWTSSFPAIAAKYDIEEALLREIVLEGIANGWPMPER